MGKKLYFVCRWNKKRENTWSGTVYSIHNELLKKFEIVEINLNEIVKIKKIRKLVEKIIPSMMVRDIKEIRKKVELNENQLVFQFTEYSQSKNSYIYIDLTAEVIRDLYMENKALFKLAGFRRVPFFYLQQRTKIQNEYLKENAKCIFTMSDWLRDYILRKHPNLENKVFSVGGGINLDEKLILDGSQRTGNKILFVGRDFCRKGGEVLLKAFSHLLTYKPDCELYIIGPKTNPNSSGIKNVFYKGDLPYEDVSYYMNKCDIFVMPSYFEAYGLVFIEALCYGLPCIGRNCYEMSKFISNGETGYLIDDDNIENLALKMLDLLVNKEIKNNVKMNKQFYLQEYSWNHVCQKIEDNLK